MVTFYLTASILLPPVQGHSPWMRNAQVTGSRLHVHTFRIIRAHRIDPGAMTFNYPPFLAPDEAIASGPWPGRHILAALGLPKEQSLVGSSPAFSPMLGSLSVSDRGKREGHFHLSNFSLPLSMLFLPSLFCSGG